MEKLIEKLREYADWAEANEWVTPIDMSDCMRDAAIRLEQMQWVRAAERLPDYVGGYLAIPRGSYDVHVVMYDRLPPVWTDEEDMECEVSHWMPLPFPPEEVLEVNEDEQVPNMQA